MTTKTQVWSDPQFDAICDAQDESKDLAALGMPEVAAHLARQGHELFKDFLDDPCDTEAPGKAEAAAPASPAPAPEPEPEEAESEAPQVPAAPAEAQAPAVPQAAPTGAVEGQEDLGADDFAIPTLKLKQEQSEGEGVSEIPNGHWFLTNDPESHSGKRRLVLLTMSKRREFALPYKDDDKRDHVLRDLGLEEQVGPDVMAICRSDDLVNPLPQPHGALSDKCETCPHGKWRKTSTGKNRRDCQEFYSTVVYDCETEAPARLRIAGTAMRSAKNLNSNIAMLGRRRKLPMFAFEFEASSSKDGEDKWYTARFGRPQPVDEDSVEFYRAMRESMGGGA